MTTPAGTKTPKHRRLRQRRGAAILLVLAVVSLMSIWVIAIFSSSAQHRARALGSDDLLRVQHVADSAVNLALAQLREGTSQSLRSGHPAPWTSQPGAVRVHRMDGSLHRLFKLYTAGEMVVADAAQAEADVPYDWQHQPEHFVDLNAPIVSRTSAGVSPSIHFPIVDPRAKSTSAAHSVAGFEYYARTAPAGTVEPGGAEDSQRLPMPVRWVYQLEDGSLGILDQRGQFHGFKGESASPANPIVARFAFWTDDESCKINVNTAGEGVFWDTPRADTAQERKLAECQPARSEYQRQPGHPAGVSLSTVLMPGRRFHASGFQSERRASGGTMHDLSLPDAMSLWSLARLGNSREWQRTSLGGTQAPGIDINAPGTGESGLPLRPPYPNIAEMLWDNVPSRRSPRTMQPFFQRHPEAATRLARGGFFLTTQSAAPETTLFGTPRIALWPVHGSTDLSMQDHAAPVERATPIDYGIARAATVAGRKYFVQRLRAGDGAWDLERANRGENKKLFDYLRTLTNRPVPGWLRPRESYTTFAEKYGPDRDGILLSMLDYIRAANFSDGQLAANVQFPILCPGNPGEGFGQVAPLITANKSKGLGRMLTVSEVALFLVCRAEVQADGRLRGEPSAANRQKLTQPGDREIEMALLLEAFVPSHGWADYMPYVSFSLTGGARGAEPDPAAPWPAMTLNGAELLPLHARPTAQSSSVAPRWWAAWGGAAGVRALTERIIVFRPVVIPNTGDPESRLRFSGSVTDRNLQLKLAIFDDPGSATSGRAGEGDIVQVIPLDIPDLGITTPAELPIPSLPQDDMAFTLERRLRAARDGARLFSNGDVVQSLVPVHGDYRLLAAMRRVEAPAESDVENAKHPMFVTHPLWGRTRFAHSLREPAPEARERVLGVAPRTAAADNPDSRGYFADLTLSAAHTPDAPIRPHEAAQSAWAVVDGETSEWPSVSLCDWTRLDGGRRGPARPDITGDFDNGIGNAPDGAYINRPDDGNAGAFARGELPYFSASPHNNANSVPPVSADVFSPHRLFPSAVAFGSLPTGAAMQVPWQTLLFRPQTDHFGAATPPDHLLLDLFWTPVLEPEPHSRALETAGKINLNHQLVPFSYIHRSTALHSAMHMESIMAIPDRAALTYKAGGGQESFRHFIDAGATIDLWDQSVFQKGRVFLSPGEICEHYLVPEGVSAQTPDELREFWSRHRLTGDNSKERPYAHLHPRFTTRSNVFRVHFIAETLRPNRSGRAGQPDFTPDAIAARQRGSCLIRRVMDVSDPSIPDYAAEPDAMPTLDAFYEWRISDWHDER